MKIVRDPETDTLTIVFSQDAIETTEEEAPGILIDYTATGQIVSIEILDASTRLALPDFVSAQLEIQT